MDLDLLKKLEVKIMAFVNQQGMSISFDCSELIKELKADIEEFGENKIVAVWCKNISGIIIYTNYDFIDKQLITEDELNDGEYIQEMTMSTLLSLFEKQNEIL